MKKGFTLIELLVVLVLISVIGASAIILFSTGNKDLNEEDLRNKYKEMQTSAIMYIDLNEAKLTEFTTSNSVEIGIVELQNQNYISSKMYNPVTKEVFPSNYIIKVYKNNNGYVDSCIITKDETNTKCVANNDGYACGCCDLEISSFNPTCSN